MPNHSTRTESEKEKVSKTLEAVFKDQSKARENVEELVWLLMDTMNENRIMRQDFERVVKEFSVIADSLNIKEGQKPSLMSLGPKIMGLLQKPEKLKDIGSLIIEMNEKYG